MQNLSDDVPAPMNQEMINTSSDKNPVSPTISFEPFKSWLVRHCTDPHRSKLSPARKWRAAGYPFVPTWQAQLFWEELDEFEKLDSSWSRGWATFLPLIESALLDLGSLPNPVHREARNMTKWRVNQENDSVIMTSGDVQLRMSGDLEFTWGSV